MYIWKTGSLSKEIKNNAVSDDDWKGYFLWVSLIMMVSMYLVSLSPRGNMAALGVEAIAIIGIIIFGINITFNTNKKGGGNGLDYIARVTALSLPIMIKLIVLSFVFVIVIDIVEQTGAVSKENQEWAMAIFSMLIEIVYFWRINEHLRYIGQ
jgi:hypothetical protein